MARLLSAAAYALNGDLKSSAAELGGPAMFALAVESLCVYAKVMVGKGWGGFRSIRANGNPQFGKLANTPDLPGILFEDSAQGLLQLFYRARQVGVHEAFRISNQALRIPNSSGEKPLSEFPTEWAFAMMVMIYLPTCNDVREIATRGWGANGPKLLDIGSIIVCIPGATIGLLVDPVHE